jgi:hypothetical protein
MYKFNQTIYLTLLSAALAAFVPAFTPAPAQATPILDVNPDTLRFYADYCDGDTLPGDTIYRGFMVSNTGDGSLTWTGEAGESWVVFEPVSGGNFDSVLVWIDWSQTPQIFAAPLPGDTLLFETSITIEAPDAANSPRQIIVQLGYTCDPEEYQLFAYPSYFELTASPNDTLSRTIFVVEAHNANIEFYLANSSNWLVLPEFFAPIYTPDSVEFMVSTFGLDYGIYYDTIVVTSSEDPDIRTAIPVRLDVSEGGYTLVSDPEWFSFTVPEGTPIRGESLYVYEAGGNSINFWTYNQAYWLHVDTMAASPLYTPGLLFIDIYSDTLPPGIYSDSIIIWGDGAENSPILVPVSVIVEADSSGYQVAASPAYVEVNTVPDTFVNKSVGVYETHGANVGFLTSTQAPWLQVAGGPYFVTPVDLDLNINTASLQPGFYIDTVFIFPDTDSVSFPPIGVPVYVQVQADIAVVHAAPDFFHFYLAPGDSIPLTSIFVYEESGQELPFAYGPIGGSEWIDLPQFLALRTTPDSLYFGIHTDGLLPGTYGDTLAIYYPFDDIYGYDDVLVPILLTVEGEPPDYHLETDPTSFNFTLVDFNYDADTLFVYDTYGQNIEFYFYNNSSWLAVEPLGIGPYFTPTGLMVIASAGELGPGVYIDTVFISSIPPDSLSPPQNLAVPVSMTVGAPFMMGDANGDDSVDVGDAVYLISYIFHEGLPPESYDAADANCDDFVDVGDVVYIISYSFRGGPEPACQ